MSDNLNGISVDAVGALVTAVRENPEKASTVWRAETVWQGGTRCAVSVRGHSYTLDEPPSLGGTNAGPNMVEEVALATGSCLAIGYALGATGRGIALEGGLQADVTGSLDLGKFLGVSDERPAGFGDVGVEVRLGVPAGTTDEQIGELHEHVVRTSPLGSILRRRVPVSVALASREAPPAPNAGSLVTNGVPLDAVGGLVAAARDDPEKRATTWRTSTAWSGAGLECRNKVRGHARVLDEPASLAGGDAGVNPVEAVVGAFSACLVVGVTLQAAVRGITLRGLRVTAEGSLDLRPFLGLADGNAGFSKVDAAVHVDAPGATDEQLRDLIDYVTATSPVGSILADEVPLRVSVGRQA